MSISIFTIFFENLNIELFYIYLDKMSQFYVNPLGEVKDISYNNIQPIKKNYITREAQVDDSLKKYDSVNMQFIIWSIVAAILILAMITLLRNVKNY